MDTLKRLYENYLKNVQAVAAAMRPGDGLFGMGRKISDDPCHDIFIENLRDFLARQEQSSSAEIHQVLSFIYHAPMDFSNADNSAYWIMVAVHGLTLPLIRQLGKEDAAELARWYEETYPSKDRLPAQKQVLHTLRTCGQIPSTTRWFGKC